MGSILRLEKIFFRADLEGQVEDCIRTFLDARCRITRERVPTASKSESASEREGAREFAGRWLLASAEATPVQEEFEKRTDKKEC
jgi:hypothetical protein